MRRRPSFLTAGALGLASLALFAAPAAAHVEASLDEQDGTTVTVTFGFHHGCDGEPTTGLDVRLPEGTTGVTAQDPEGWTSTATDTVISWTGGSVPDGDEAAFTASMTLTTTDGETVAFPTVQTCPTATNDWIQIAEPGGEEPENPAPTIVMGTVGAPEHEDGEADHAAADDEHATEDEHEDAAADAEAEAADTEPSLLGAEDTDTESAASTSDNDDSSTTGLIVGAVVVVALLAGGGFVLANRRKAAA